MRRTLLALVLVAVAVGGCSSDPLRASGVVVSVDQISLTEVRSFTLRTDTGELMVFRVGLLDVTDGGFPANHLREHMATVSSVAIDYTKDRGDLVAIRLTDAP